MNKMSLLYLCFYSVQMFLLERSVSNGATPKVSLSHCILVLFCTSPMIMGQKGLRHRGLTSIPKYQPHCILVLRDWDKRGLRLMIDLHPYMSVSHYYILVLFIPVP